MWEFLAGNLPHLTAVLNLTATVLLLMGLISIKRGRARRHKTMMLSALGVSAVFLLIYLLQSLQVTRWENRLQ